VTTTKEWTEADIKALGVKTDLVTACRAVLGCGKDKARELYHAGELPFPTLKVGRKIVVPTAPLRKLLGLDDDPAI
jgi:hypothetical protein